jgi:dihydropyrimidinase
MDSERYTGGRHPKLYGLYPQKGTIAIGSDADIALWDPAAKVTLTNHMLPHGADYTPYEGLDVKGWPVRLLARGRTITQRGVLVDKAQGRYQRRSISNLRASDANGVKSGLNDSY